MKRPLRYGVITRAGPVTGNLVAALIYDTGGEIVPGAFLYYRTENFEVGEIVICDEVDGREVAGKQRKPSKWDVDVEWFIDIERAVDRAREVSL